MCAKINRKFLADLLMLFVLITVISLYSLINEPHGTVYVLRSVIDDWIPRIPAFSVVYLAFLPWVALTIFFAWYKKHDFRQLLYSLIVVNMIAYTVYLIFQTHVPRDPIVSNDIFSRIMQFIYDHDGSYNCFPSLHSAFSTVVATYFVLQKSRWSWAAVTFAFLIIISTLFVKQHFIADAISGVILGFVVTWAIYNCCFKKPPTN